MAERPEHREEKAFRAKRAICHYQERIQAPPDRIFPLLCPIEEYKWIDEWECELVYSESGVVENNCIFREELSTSLLSGSPAQATWIVTLDEPDHFRRHFVIMSGGVVRKGEVSIQDSGDGVSTVRWTTIATTLNAKANEAFDELESRLELMLRFLAASLRHYCETGKILRRSEFLSSQGAS